MWQVEWLILWKMIVKMLTHLHIVVYTWRYWHICKGDEVGVDVDQLGNETKARRVRNSTGGVSARRVRTVQRCHRRPIQKRQGPTVWTKLWSRSDRTLRLSVRSMVAVSVQRRSVDRMLALKVTGCWRQCLVLLSDEVVSLESDRTLGLRPITSDQTCPVGVGTLL